MAGIQSLLYGITLLGALLAAIFGILIADRLALKKTVINNSIRFVFAMLAIGYTCFALAELGWFLIFKVFNELPTASMPDFYWVVGSSFLLVGFITFTLYAFRAHHEQRKLLLLVVFAAVILAITIYIISSVAVIPQTSGERFLTYFYPIMSSLIFIFSLSIYLFIEKIQDFKSIFFLFMLANAGFLGGDLLYIMYSTIGVYGVIGVASDLLYIGAYLLSTFAFMFLLRELHTQASPRQE